MSYYFIRNYHSQDQEWGSGGVKLERWESPCEHVLYRWMPVGVFTPSPGSTLRSCVNCSSCGHSLSGGVVGGEENSTFFGEEGKIPVSIFFFIYLIFIFLTSKTFCIGVQLINYVVIISGQQWRDSAIHINGSILPQTRLPSRLPCNIEQSSICYTMDFCWLSTLNIAVCTWPSQSPELSLPSLTSSNHEFLF